MRDNQKLNTVIGETLQAFSPFYQEGITKLLPPNSWFLLDSVRANEPEPFTLEQMAELGPYASPKVQAERADELVEAGFLVQTNGESFQLTDKGRRLIEGFFNAAHEGLADIRPLSAEEMVQTKDLQITRHLTQLLPGHLIVKKLYLIQTVMKTEKYM